jgi:2'-5' RNA ligase
LKEFHSIWLMPAAEDETLLQATVDELAARFDAPRFQPHLTLVEDMTRSWEDLAPPLREIAAGLSAFDATVRGIGTSALYFRSFYALFDSAGPLRELKRRAIEKIAPDDLDGFMPHVSLLYGVADGPGKREAREAMAGRLVGRRIRFDRLSIVASSREIPIADWTVRSSVSLPGAQGSQG